MMGLRALVNLALGAWGIGLSAVWGRQLATARREGRHDDPATDVRLPSTAHLAIGFGGDFLDTLGIGSYATTTALYKFLRLVPDHLIPGTLFIGHAWPTLVQACLYITFVDVDMTTLVALVGAAVGGSWMGAGVVARWPKRKIQLGMGVALVAVAFVMAARQLGFLPAGGQALGLQGWRLATGAAGNFTLGALMTVGIGCYAPSLILFGLLGINTKSIFPIMMASSAFLQPVGAIRFLRHGRYSARAALGLTIGGTVGVVLAATLVREIPLDALRWLVVGVVISTAMAMLRSATRPGAASAAPSVEAPPLASFSAPER